MDQLSRFKDSTECGGNALAEALLQRGRTYRLIRVFTITMNITNNTGTSAQLELKRFEMLEHLVRRTLDEAVLRGDLSTVRRSWAAQTFCLKTERTENLSSTSLESLRYGNTHFGSVRFWAVSYERVKFNSSTVSPVVRIVTRQARCETDAIDERVIVTSSRSRRD